MSIDHQLGATAMKFSRATVIAAPENEPAEQFYPSPVTRIEDTGLSPLWLQDLALKILYFQGYLTGFKVSEEIALPFAGVTDQILEALKREKFVEVVKSSQIGLGEGAYQYAITSAGIDRAREALERSQYAGPAPVPLHTYNESVIRQSRDASPISHRAMRQVLSHLVVSEQLSTALALPSIQERRFFFTVPLEMARRALPRLSDR